MSLAELFFRKNPRPSFWSRLRRSKKPSLVSRRSSLAGADPSRVSALSAQPSALLL